MTRRLASTAFALLLIAPLAASAQEEGDVRTSVLLIPEGDIPPAAAAYVNMGLRRGIREVPNVTYVNPVDALGAGFNEEVQNWVDQLEALADQVRTGDATDAYRRADEAIELFENNLRFVRRTQLVDAYMLAAIGRCRAGRTDECRARIRDIIAFRESLVYDIDRYPPEFAEQFEIQKARALSGARGALVVETQPEGVEVFIDGRSYGPSPARADGLLAGQHYVTVKELGFDELAVRAEVRAGREGTESYPLIESDRARSVLNLRDGIRGELGEQAAGPNIRSLASSLGTAQVIVGVLRPAAAGQVHAQLYLYHVHTRLLQGQAEATLSDDEAGSELARGLAGELYRGVDLTGGIEAPEDDTVIHGPQPELYEQWWFWVAVIGGAGLVAAAVAIGVEFGGGEQIPATFTRFSGEVPITVP